MSSFQIEAAFWKHLGITPDKVDRYPEELVRRYLIVMDEIAAWEEGQAELAARKAQAEARQRG